MIRSLFNTAGVVSLTLLAAGCGGGGGGVSLPAADNTLPDVVETTNRIGDYLQPGTGTWRINLDGQVDTVGYGTATLQGALIYDTNSDQWVLNVDAQNLTLSWGGSGIFSTSDAYWTPTCTNCALFESYVDPIVSQYGTFGYVYYETDTKTVEFYAHWGLKTASVDMPISGTGTYSGTFWGTVNYTDPNLPYLDFDWITGTADLTAQFASGGGTVAFTSSGTGYRYAGSGYLLSGTATISGNSYQGTVSGYYDDGLTAQYPSLVLDSSQSSLSGAFYGPNADETAGVVYATSAPADPYWGELAGGFWAQQTSYTP